MNSSDDPLSGSLVSGDLAVAAVAAVCTVGLALVLEAVLGADTSLFVKIAPLYVYFAYLFTRKGGPYTAYDTPLTWSVLTVVVTVAAIVAFGL
jgi:hypothetical protein